MKNAMKKLLSLALALVLVVGVCPMAAFAAEGDTYKVTVQLKIDDSDEVHETMVLDGVKKGTEIDVAALVSRSWSKYDFSHYWTKATGTKTSGTVTIMGETTIDVRMTTPNAGSEGEDEDKDQGKDDNKDEGTATTYTILLNVYQIKDNEAKEWASKSITLEKPSATLSELVSASGYGSYESVYAMINGARFSGTAAIAIENGAQVDLFVTPKATNNKPGADTNKPSTDTNKPGADTNKPSTDTNKPTTDTTKPGKGEKVTLRVFHNDGTSNYTDIRCYTTDSLLDVINANEELSELSRDGYKLIGWAFEANNDYYQEWIAAQHKVSDDDDLRVYADWEETKPGKGDKPSKEDDDDDGEDEVLLKIYVNGNTKSAAKVVDMDAYDNDGKITLAEATKVVNKYYEQASDDDDMDIDGLFTYSTWNGGNYSMKNAKNSITVNEKGDTIIYVMVRDAQKISSGTADTTNPKTGDTIFMAVTVMALSASALAVVYFFNKKRAVK